MDISLLRQTAIVFGVFILLIAFLRLRTQAKNRFDVFLMGIIGIGSVSLGFFPGLMSMPAELLFIRKFEGFRIITLLAIAVVFLGALLFRERHKSITRDEEFDKLFRWVAVSSKKVESNDSPIAIIMPALNEAENLAKVLPSIPVEINGHPIKVIVVDDGSTDDTGDIVEQYNAVLVKHPFNRGGGVALRSGYDMALKLDAKIVVTMDADGQHKASDISKLVTPILDNEADIVIGSRFLGHREPDSFIRLVGIHVFNFMIRLLLGRKITDCTSGFRAFRMSSLKQLRLLQDQYHTAELIIEALKRKLRIVEQPITIESRLFGSSKKGTNLIYGFGFFRSVIKTWFR